jgi:acetyltransferase-like isoleucine patch superfamily enzyme
MKKINYELFDESCNFNLSEYAFDAVTEGKLKINISKGPSIEKIFNLTCFIDAIEGDINLYFDGARHELHIGKVTGRYSLTLHRDSKVTIGDFTTSNGLTIYSLNSSTVIGDDCMISSEVVIQASDQHPIVELENGSIINLTNTTVNIGNHVWLGRRSSIIHGTSIGNGSILAFASLATGNYGKNSIIVGHPGEVTKTGITWKRTPL